jgi:hypothetical protein
MWDDHDIAWRTMRASNAAMRMASLAGDNVRTGDPGGKASTCALTDAIHGSRHPNHFTFEEFHVARRLLAALSHSPPVRCAGLSQQADPPGRSVRTEVAPIFFAADRRQADRGMEAAGRRRESTGRRRQHRDGCRQRAKDGYTLILGHVGTLAVNPAMFAKPSTIRSRGSCRFR